MGQNYTEMEEKKVELGIEDLEDVSGGLKWGPERLSGKGPRYNAFGLNDMRPLAEDIEKEPIGSREKLEIAEELKKRGGFA